MSPILTIIVILIGLYGLATSKNIIKSVFCVTIIEAGVILLFLRRGIYPHSWQCDRKHCGPYSSSINDYNDCHRFHDYCFSIDALY